MIEVHLLVLRRGALCIPYDLYIIVPVLLHLGPHQLAQEYHLLLVLAVPRLLRLALVPALVLGLLHQDGGAHDRAELEEVALLVETGRVGVELALAGLGDVGDHVLGHLLLDSLFHDLVEFAELLDVVLHLHHHGVYLVLLLVVVADQ